MGIPYKFTNGYEEINTAFTQDFDILFKKQDFTDIYHIVISFCKAYGYSLVQMYHQEVYAKNFFVVNPANGQLLNLDLYGELARQRIKILTEKEVFAYTNIYKDLSILMPEDEFIQYLIKNIDKGQLTKAKFNKLCHLYKVQSEACNKKLVCFFPMQHRMLIEGFLTTNCQLITDNLSVLKADFLTMPKSASTHRLKNTWRLIKRIIRPTGFTICFLGPDGSGKSTVTQQKINFQIILNQHFFLHETLL